MMLWTVTSLLTAATQIESGGTFWMPEQASTVAQSVDFTFDVITWISYFFFFGIVGVLILFMVKYRRKTHSPTTEGPTHNTTIEIVWTVVPLLLVTVIFVVGMRGYLNLIESPEGSYEVSVTAQTWFWTFDHPEYGATQVGELTVPVGKPVRLLMTSQDFLHSLWIPSFRVKMDVIPGRYTTLWFEATKVGDYRLLCTEYCGRDHSNMQAIVHVIPADEFKERMVKLASEYVDMSIDELPAYAINRLYNRCQSCHTKDGSESTGPTFVGLWDRVKSGDVGFTSGEKLSSLYGEGTEYVVPENYIRLSLLNPQKHIVKGFLGAMPSFQGQLKEKQITAIIEMFKHFDDLVDADGNIKVNTDGTPRD
jgi:cytochrome c oxidase subunit 2